MQYTKDQQWGMKIITIPTGKNKSVTVRVGQVVVCVVAAVVTFALLTLVL